MTDLGTIAQATAAMHGGAGMEAGKLEELVALIAENGPQIMAGTVGAGPYVVALTVLIQYNGAPPNGIWKNTLRSIVGVKPAPEGIVDLGQRAQAKLDAEAKTLVAAEEGKQVITAKAQADDKTQQELGAELKADAMGNRNAPLLNTPLPEPLAEAERQLPSPADREELFVPHSDEPA